MGRGRPPKPGTAEEKAAARRERVRNNVRALRERRKKEAALLEDDTGAEKLQVEWVDSELVDKAVCDFTSESSNFGCKSRKSSDASSKLLESSNSTESHALYQVNRQGDSKVGFPVTLDTKSPYSLALLATVRQQFLPDSVYLPPAIDGAKVKPWENDQFLWTPCAFWVTSAFTKACDQETGVLKTTMLSLGMLMKSLEFQDAGLKVASLEMYRRCLQGIRKSLEPLIEGKSDRPKDSVALYLSCHAAAMFELIQSSDLRATMHHLRGVSQLICHLGDNNDEDGQSMAWFLLQDYRFAEMGLCLKYRYTSYSSIKRREFKNTAIVNLAQRHTSHNMLVRLTDIADDISLVMVQLDKIRLQMKRPDLLVKIRGLLEDLDTIWESFDILYSRLVSNYGSAFVYADDNEEGPGPGSFKFKTYDVGAGWCYQLMAQLHCLETKIETIQLLSRIQNDPDLVPSPPESRYSGKSDETGIESINEETYMDKLQDLRKTHRTICIQLAQCLQYFLQTDKGITGQALSIFPLDTAICMLEVELQRLKFDLKDGEDKQESKDHINQIHKDIASIVDARAFCWKMQDRATAFGLPTLRYDESIPPHPTQC